MQILWHRANKPASFRAALRAGLGAELDIRDLARGLVVSHGLPTARAVKLEKFLKVYAPLKPQPPLALNIKACGLQGRLLALVKRFRIKNYFVFDMSVPDGVEYLKSGMKIFTRQSEYERAPAFYGKARGVWLDEFYSSWIGPEAIKEHLASDKRVCVVSPELHNRNFKKTWRELKKIEAAAGSGQLMLCTDFPRRAELYFNGRN